MPTDKDFEDLRRLGFSDSRRIIQALPNPGDLEAYCAWLHARSQAFRAPPISCADFVAQIDSANLMDKTVRIKLTRSAMENIPPVVPIGSDIDNLYRLVVDPYHLIPHDQNCSYRTLDGTEELMSGCILGVNTTIQPREPALPVSCRNANLSERSTRSAESDDDDTPGFIFFQLGTLQYAWHNHEDNWSSDIAEEVAATMDDDDDGNVDWLDTEFYLVARLGQSGRTTGVYAIYNMFQTYGNSCYRRQIVHDQWGILPPLYGGGERQQFSMARIGDTLGCLGYGKPLVLEEKVEHPVELVRVKPSGNALGAIRQTVDDTATFNRSIH
ncbi:hypothetical protein GGS23DRAFT_583344 [Durotheca rogersii]|uniref:uncharacterized protein n=1 Tax=Durotheca rogersii TaxID=419775 RepID=UPI00221F4280|nr:uncharacterized protein GGS23DRAFT_583344 [Durotheca rogersii]KAI5859981.1 hypothetical protein GGS23DRAFT_583344 [Durotheca rogersii]